MGQKIAPALSVPHSATNNSHEFLARKAGHARHSVSPACLAALWDKPNPAPCAQLVT